MILVKISSSRVYGEHVEPIPQKLLPKAKHLSALLLGFSFLILCLSMCSCSSARHIQVANHIQRDTLYLRNVQYDSIYIDRSSDIDRTRDTITITKTKTEFRYKLLRDTVRIVQRDSIPYQVTVVETKEIVRPLTFFDHLTRAIFWLICGAIFVLFVRLVFKKKKVF